MQPTSVPEYVYAAAERPLFPGSPFSPRHSSLRRAGYVGAAIVTGIASTFGNALTNVNVGTIAGSLGLDVAEATLLPAIYVAFNAGANLTLVKARAQFGIPEVTLTLLVIYIAAAVLQIAEPGLPAAMMIRAIDGMTAASLVTLTTYFLIQVFPPKRRPLALVIAIGLSQIGTPLARMVPVDLLATGQWRGLHLIELAVALGTFCTVAAMRLPPSERATTFEPLDIAVIALMVLAIVLFCEVIGLGRTYWWTDLPALGVMASLSVGLFVGALLIESRRRAPLVQWGWIGRWGIFRFAGAALVIRLGLAEQTYGAVGLLTSSGLDNDQLRFLFGLVAISMIAGIVVAALTLSERRLPWQVLIAALMIAASAWLDSRADNLTRPPELIVSQMLMGFGTTLFIGPALVYGFLRMLREGGGQFFVTFVVLFSVTQNVGGLLGSALLGSMQTVSARHHLQTLSEREIGSDPAVATRLQAGATAFSATTTDPVAQTALGAGRLAQATAREANVLAYNDVFRAVMMLALATAAFIAASLAASARGRRTRGGGAT